jgi:hypothetical protein
MGWICIFLGAGFLVPIWCSCVAASRSDDKIEKILKDEKIPLKES